jgi:hypothetical protein
MICYEELAELDYSLYGYSSPVNVCPNTSSSFGIMSLGVVDFVIESFVGSIS